MVYVEWCNYVTFLTIRDPENNSTFMIKHLTAFTSVCANFLTELPSVLCRSGYSNCCVSFSVQYSMMFDVFAGTSWHSSRLPPSFLLAGGEYVKLWLCSQLAGGKSEQRVHFQGKQLFYYHFCLPSQ